MALRRFFASDASIILLAGCAGLWVILARDRINVNKGLGWDGAAYVWVARDFPRMVFGRQLSAYQVLRVLPAGIVYAVFRLLDIAHTDGNDLRAFRALDAACLIGIGFVWCQIVRELRLRPRGKWLGFIALFVSFGALKWPSYYSLLTDMPAYLLGCLLIYYYLARKPVGLALATLAAALTWTEGLYIGAILLVWPRETPDEDRGTHAPYRLNDIVALGAAAALLVFIQVLLRSRTQIRSGTMDPVSSVLGFSIFLSLLQVFLGLREILDLRAMYSPTVWRTWLTRRHLLTRWLPVFVLFAAVLTFQNAFRYPRTSGDVFWYLQFIALESITLPAINLVAHAVFFGPLMILVMLLWRPICRQVQRWGTGLTLAVAAAVLLGLSSESRQLFLIYPLLVPALVKVADSFDWRVRHIVALAGLSLVYSKVWLTIGAIQPRPFLSRYPDVLYWMNQGPWMAVVPYLAQGVLVALTAAGLYLALVRGRSHRPEIPLAGS